MIAFEIFVECRESVCELRINEVKRRVSWVMEKMNARVLVDLVRMASAIDIDKWSRGLAAPGGEGSE